MTRAVSTLEAANDLVRVGRAPAALNFASARNPGGRCLARLTPQPFRNVDEPYRHQQQSWNLLIEPPDLTVWQRELSREGWAFRFSTAAPPPENRAHP